jgi:penicillin G amidase
MYRVDQRLRPHDHEPAVSFPPMITSPPLISLCLLLCVPPVFAGPNPDYGRIELLRDNWGVPHVFSDTDAGAMYGLGYATAEDRALQMTYHLRLVQGRLSEVIGEVRMLRRDETSIDHDRKMRTFGFYRAARRTVTRLDPDTIALLEAYSEGVNDGFAAQRAAGTLHPLFAQLELEPEPWTPTDCLAVWWHVGQFFATDGTRDLIARRNREQASPDRPARVQADVRPGRLDAGGQGTPSLPADAVPLPPDEAASVVRRGDVSEEWIQALEDYARERGLRGTDGDAAGPTFSHAWVVGGKRTTTGSSVLVSDPQTPVRNPSLFYQFHIRGKTFNARGMGVPGNPTFLIGFSERVAWGITAMGADQADLFLLETDPARPDQYRFDGEWRSMTVHREAIRVKGRQPIPFVVRETRLGPVATAFVFARPDEGEVALKRVPVCEDDRDTIQGAIAMMRAQNATEFRAALEGWRFPSANFVYGDREGNIGYIALAAIPVRSRHDPDFGRIAMPGTSSERDWQEILPYDLLPQVMNPAAGVLYSGNHRAIESWYPIPIFGMTGSGGDTVRSRRLRERLEARARFTPEQVLDIHYDSVNPARRDIVRLGLHLRDILGHEFSADARAVLARLEPWYHAGASSALSAIGAEVAVELNTFFRVGHTDLAILYGGGESGLSYFLKTATARIDLDPQSGFTVVERHFIEQALAGAWHSARQKYGPDPDVWNQRAREAVGQRKLGYMESLDGFPSLDPDLDLAFPSLTVTDGGTITSQASQSYTQWVPMHDPDQALAILPIGQSERPDSPARTSTFELWAEGRLHPAPLSREKVESITRSRQRLDAELQSRQNRASAD